MVIAGRARVNGVQYTTGFDMLGRGRGTRKVRNVDRSDQR